MTETLVAFDTSVWVQTLLHGDDVVPHDATVVVPEIVLAEIRSLVEQGRLKAPRAIDAILASARVEALTLADMLHGGELHGALRKRGSKASLVACLIYATARRVGATLVTRDRDLAREPGVRVV